MVSYSSKASGLHQQKVTQQETVHFKETQTYELRSKCDFRLFLTD